MLPEHRKEHLAGNTEFPETLLNLPTADIYLPEGLPKGNEERTELPEHRREHFEQGREHPRREQKSPVASETPPRHQREHPEGN